MSKIAIVGVMDGVGREFLTFLEIDGISSKNIFAVEPKIPMGNRVSYGEDDELDVHNLDDFDFSKVDVAVFAVSSELSKKYIPKALSKGTKVVDCSTAYLSDSDVPMIIAGFNPDDVLKAKKGLVSIPSPYVCQTLLPLKSLDENYIIKRIVTSTYTSASVYGKRAMDELFNQTRKIFMNTNLSEDKKIFNKQIAFNAIPQVGDFIGDETSEEWSINVETKKIVSHDIKVHANCAFIPAFIGIAQFVNVEFEKDINVDDAKELIEKTTGVSVFDKQIDGGYFCLTDIQGEDNVYISRLRQDVSVENGLSFWVVSDNLRASTAKNAFKTMKLLIKKQ